MEKKNTVLLTVIAIATLLVAVVGATFAYFSASVTQDATVTVQAETAKANDVFLSAAGEEDDASIILDQLTNENMSKAQAGSFVDDDTATIEISLNAGSGKATCTYDLVWTETSAIPYAKSTKLVDGQEVEVTGNEFTLQGTDGTQKVDEIEVHTIGEKLGSGTISDDFDDALTATKQTWTFTGKFYNTVDPQNQQLDKVYAGNIKVTNVQCNNNGKATN